MSKISELKNNHFLVYFFQQIVYYDNINNNSTKSTKKQRTIQMNNNRYRVVITNTGRISGLISGVFDGFSSTDEARRFVFEMIFRMSRINTMRIRDDHWTLKLSWSSDENEWDVEFEIFEN